MPTVIEASQTPHQTDRNQATKTVFEDSRIALSKWPAHGAGLKLASYDFGEPDGAMKDETWGALAWWIATIVKWVGLLAAALFVLFLLAVAIGMHGWPF